MATKNPRINVTIDPETAAIIALMAKKEKKTVSAKANDYIKQAIEHDEDLYWIKLAEERIKEGGEYISHEEAWKRLL